MTVEAQPLAYTVKNFLWKFLTRLRDARSLCKLHELAILNTKQGEVEGLKEWRENRKFRDRDLARYRDAYTAEHEE